MEVEGAKAAAAIMGMNNIYYRFLHLVEDGEYQTMPARLRMNVIANHGIDKLDFELISLAVSAVNGCGLCVTSHEKKLRSHDVSREAIQSAVRIAATIHAVAVTLEFEQSAAGGGSAPPSLRPEQVIGHVPPLWADNGAPGYPGAFFFCMTEQHPFRGCGRGAARRRRLARAAAARLQLLGLPQGTRRAGRRSR